MKSKYKVWECKIVVPADADLPAGFDSPPRRAAENAVESIGVEIIACFSGWGGRLNAIEEEIIENPTVVPMID